MRENIVLEFWDRSKFLTVKNKDYLVCVKKMINGQLKEDIGNGDITTNSLIKEGKKIKASVISKQDGIVAGIEEAFLFGLNIKKIKIDGSKANKGDVILKIYDDAKKILAYERTLLNIMQRMSGIATAAYNIKKIIGNRCFIAGTRKTPFGMLDKKALSVGGALTHRLNLEDSILVKDNHIKLLGNDIRKALFLADNNKNAKYVEIEVKNENEALEAANVINKLKTKKLFAIMFDNMDASIIKSTINKINNSIINANHNKNNKKIILFEASGGINEKNILEYSKTGVDVISLGSLTHSAKALDISLEII